MRYGSFGDTFGVLKDRMRMAPAVHTEKWQGFDISKRPEAKMHEIINIFFTVPTMGVEQLTHYQNVIEPNLPWADEHFEERVGGHPLNPPPSWVRWPFAHSAEKALEGEQFNHTYPERFWPKWAGLPQEHNKAHTGIRYAYGDLDDVVNLLASQPLTRQAFLPIFFPEDTGAVHGGRVPCTIGYHFLMREGRLHLFYYIRSCDFVRHFRDDVYLAIRLQLWMLDKLRQKDPRTWTSVRPGDFSMHIGSLHMFINDHVAMFR